MKSSRATSPCWPAAHSTYCYLLAEAEHQERRHLGIHLLDAQAQGFNPDYTLADAGSGLRAGQRIVNLAG